MRPWWQENLTNLLKRCLYAGRRNLLVNCLLTRRTNVKIAEEISDGNDLVQIAEKYNIKKDDSPFQLHFERRWWLENLFREKMHIFYVEGTFLIYALTIIPRILVLPIIISSNPQAFQMAYFVSYVGDLVVVFAFLLLEVVHDGLKQLVFSINKDIVDKLVAPPGLIKEEELRSEKMLEALDDRYRRYYARPIMGKTLQLGLDLVFNKTYQLCSGAIASGICVVILMMRYVLNWVPESVISLSIPISAIANYWMYYSVFMVAFLWFMMGMMAWSLFTCFLIVIQASGNPIRIRPFEEPQERFRPFTSLALRLSLSVTVIAAWFSPYSLVWSLAARSKLAAQSVTNFAEAVLVVTIPVIIISFVVPIVKIHSGISKSRDRALSIKSQQLEDLEKQPIADLNLNAKLQRRVSEDYVRIQSQSEWPLSLSQSLQVFATTLFPIVTFLLSRL
jgi:hypothetical protein